MGVAQTQPFSVKIRNWNSPQVPEMVRGCGQRGYVSFRVRVRRERVDHTVDYEGFADPKFWGVT